MVQRTEKVTSDDPLGSPVVQLCGGLTCGQQTLPKVTNFRNKIAFSRFCGETENNDIDVDLK